MTVPVVHSKKTKPVPIQPILVKDLLDALAACPPDAEVVLSINHLQIVGLRKTENLLQTTNNHCVELLIENKKVTRTVYKLIDRRMETEEVVEDMNDPRAYSNRNPSNSPYSFGDKI